MAIKPFYYYTQKAVSVYEALNLSKASKEEVTATLKVGNALIRYMFAHGMSEMEYCEAFGALMKSLADTDFADRWAAKNIRTWVRMADVAHNCERNDSLKHLLEQ